MPYTDIDFEVWRLQVVLYVVHFPLDKVICKELGYFLGSKPILLRIVMSKLWFKDGKNWNMSKARILVDFSFAYLDLTMCIRATPTSVVDLNFSPPS